MNQAIINESKLKSNKSIIIKMIKITNNIITNTTRCMSCIPNRGITTDSYHVNMVVRAVLRGVCAPIGASPAVALAVGGPTPRRGGTVKSDKMALLA